MSKNVVQVVMGLQKEPTYLPQLFKRLEEGPQDPAWGDLLAFLQEMCGLAKHLQPASSSALMTRLHQLGLFQVCSVRLLPKMHRGCCGHAQAKPGQGLQP